MNPSDLPNRFHFRVTLARVIHSDQLRVLKMTPFQVNGTSVLKSSELSFERLASLTSLSLLSLPDCLRVSCAPGWPPGIAPAH